MSRFRRSTYDPLSVQERFACLFFQGSASRQTREALLAAAVAGRYTSMASPTPLLWVGWGSAHPRSMPKAKYMDSPRLRTSPAPTHKGRYGIVVGNASAGDLWLRDEKGVVMQLAPISEASLKGRLSSEIKHPVAVGPDTLRRRFNQFGLLQALPSGLQISKEGRFGV
jgi:hypothetical protein